MWTEDCGGCDCESDVCEPHSESFIYTRFDSGYSCWSASDSECAVDSTENLYAELETKQHAHSFLIYHNEREREIVDLMLGLIGLYQRFWCKSQAAGSLQHILYNAKASL